MKASNLILVLIILLAVAMPALAVNEYSEFAGADSHIRGVGWAQINTKAMSGAINAGDEAPDIFILRKGDVKNFTPGYYPDGTKFNRSEDNAVEVKLLPDGIAEWVTLTPGEYVAILPDGNAGQEERREFVIREGTIEYVNFQGHAISTKLSTQLQAFGLKIIKATWGAEECYEQTYKYIYHEEVNHTVHHENTVRTVCYPEVNHTERQISTFSLITPGTPAVYGWVITTPWEDGTCMVDTHVGATKCEQRLVVDMRGYCEEIENQDGWDEIVVDEKAWVETVIKEVGTCVGSTYDVTEIVRGEASGFRVYIPASRYEELFGDPSPTLHPKWLKVWYTLGSRPGTLTIPDTEDLLIDYTCGD